MLSDEINLYPLRIALLVECLLYATHGPAGTYSHNSIRLVLLCLFLKDEEIQVQKKGAVYPKPPG